MDGLAFLSRRASYCPSVSSFPCPLLVSPRPARLFPPMKNSFPIVPIVSGFLDNSKMRFYPAFKKEALMEKAGEDRGGRASHRTTGQAKWTFMVYMAGDNNLDGAALRDIAEMAKAGSTKDVHILVQLDRIEDQKTRSFLITPGGGFKKDCIESFGDINTGDPQILYSFGQWAVDNYPADRYALILWNHGRGWWEDAKSRAAGPAGKNPRRPLFRHTFPQAHRSICYDDTGSITGRRILRRRIATGICRRFGTNVVILKVLS
ncbi:MAG: hypothetical protein FJ122_06665, partial [Deltaproteobacteria bacterium]|nr:hypothetical protein [Deltaproteobacteria bacterium]